MKRSALSLLVFTLSAVAQTSSQPTLDALLNEVRQLRLTLERSNSIAPRMQLLMQRAQIQDSKVTRLSRDLQDVRENLAHHTAEMATLKTEMDRLESQSLQEINPAKKTELADIQRHIKQEWDQRTAADQHLRERETELMSQLRIEQANLDMLQAKLDALDKALDSPSRN
jgi:hypothetical protein